MKTFIWNLILALFWAAISDDFTVFNLGAGFIFGLIVLFILKPQFPQEFYFSKIKKTIFFLFFYTSEVIKSSIRVAMDVLTPTHYMNPGVIALPLKAKTDAEITLLANLISLTPGSLTLDISDDRTELYIHAMYIDQGDIELYKKNLSENFERRVLELLR